MKFTIETKYIVPEECIGTDKKEASYEAMLEKIVDGKITKLRLISEKFADNDDHERRCQLRYLYQNIRDIIQKEQFPKDTTHFKSTMIDGVTRHHSPYYPDGLVEKLFQ